ncbi:hypothetical protein Tco_1216051 [Tanacetum coccineum]
MNGKNPLTLDFNTFTTSIGLDYNNGAYVAHPSLEVVKAELARIVTNPSYLDKTQVLKNPFPVAWRILLTFVIQGPEDFGALSKKRKQPKPKKIPSETKVSSPKPTEGFEQSHSVFSSTVPDPQDLERNIQLASTGLPSTLDEGTYKSQPLPEASNEGIAKTMPRPERPLGDKDSGGNKPPTDMEPIYPTVTDPSGTREPSYEGEPDIKALQLKTFANVQALLLSDDEMVQETNDEEVFKAEEDMDEDTQEDTKVQSPPPNTDKPESSPIQDTDESTSNCSLDLKKFNNILPLTERQLVKYLKKVSRVLFNRLIEAQWAQHEEVVVSYADLKAAIEGYYEENIDHREQTNKVINAAMNSLDKNNITRGDLLNALNEATESLKAIQDAVKEDLVLNKKVLEAIEAYTTNSTHFTELLILIKNFDFQGLKSSIESIQATTLTQEDHLASWAKSSTSMAWNLSLRMTAVESSQAEIRSEISFLRKDTSDIKSMMTEIYYKCWGENVTQTDTVEPPSHIEGEHAAMEEEPTNVVPITIKQKAIVTGDQPEDQRKLVAVLKEARPNPDALILMPYKINGTIFQLTNEQIQAHLDKEKKIKKAAEEAKMFEMTKTEVIKVVQEEAEKIGLDPKKIISAKTGEKFKKAQDAEHQVLKREHPQKAKRAMELRMKRVKQYTWTMSNRLKPELITYVKIYPNTKPVVLTVYRNNDKRNFKVHNLFKFGDFRITELDELGLIIKKKKNSIVKDLMTSLEKRYERLKKIPKELRIQSALPAPVLRQVAS